MLSKRAVVSYAAEEPIDLVLVSGDTNEHDPALAAHNLIRRSAPVAVFPGGHEIRQIVTGGTPAQDASTRREMGRSLTADTQLRLTPAAWSMLAAGAVDPRLMGLLARTAEKHTIDVADFPRDRVTRAAGAPALRMRVTAVDGVLVKDSSSALKKMRRLFRGQQPGSGPFQMTAERRPRVHALLVTVLLPRPTGTELPALLPSNGETP